MSFLSTSATPKTPAEVINARRTESLDAPAISKLVQLTTKSQFGRVNIVNLIERAVLAVTLSNERDDVLGHAAFLDYPNLSDVDQAHWEHWLKTSYKDTVQCSSLNTLFLHYFVAKPDYSHGCAEEIIRTLFNAVPELHYCFLVVPLGVFPESALSAIFTPVSRAEDGVAMSGQDGALFVCKWCSHVPVLHIRPARVEDSSDLMPIFLRQNKTLMKTYSTFFLAEMIEAQDENMKCLVAEVDGFAIGFMSLTRELDIDLLNECFELGPFHGLRTPHPDDENMYSEEEVPAHVEEGEAKARTASQSVASDVAPDELAEISGVNPEPYTRNSSAASHATEKEAKLKVQRKLSDDPQGSIHSSLLSDRGEAESLKSEVLHKAPSTASDSQSDAEKVARPCTALPPPVDIPPRRVPVLHGKCSAFSIELFVIDDKYEMRSVDFLRPAFELFPDLHYIAITVPHMVPEFPLLQQFVRVTARCPSVLSQQLYVFCKDGLRVDFDVRPAKDYDNAAIFTLVQHLQLKQNLMQDLDQYIVARRDDDGTELKSFVAVSKGQIVGVAIIRREENIEHIRSHYNIEDFIYFNHHQREEHCSLHHYALNPIFKHYSKHFLKEILRLAHKTCMYYKLFPPYVEKEVVRNHSLVASLSDMVPVKARRQIVYPLDILGGNAPSERVLRSEQPYALNHINRKLTLEPKVSINAQIVVIGASDVSIAFLETFTFCPHLRFNNLTLISPHGLPGELPIDQLRDQLTSKSECYNQADYDHMSLRTWVNVVYGKMVAINRKSKYVEVAGGTRVPYDHLVLATGTQYQDVKPTGADIRQLMTSADMPVSSTHRRQGSSSGGMLPQNVFVLNDVHDAAVVMNWCQRELFDCTDNVLVYGNNIDTFCCVQALLSLGIEGDRITMVQPPLDYEPSCFIDPAVENAALNKLKDCGVARYEGFMLAQWNDGKDYNMEGEVYAVSFTSSSKPLRLTCRAVFTYYKKLVDLDAFNAINDACLVYDGRLVIDTNFHTNDVAIRGAGPLTKFQRSYHAEPWTHANFNSREIGMQLANTMLPLFDPTLDADVEPPKDLLKLIPMYQNAKMQSAFLPGEFYYLNMMKPSLNTPLETKHNHCDYGRELITGHPGSDVDYFRLHINHYNTIESLTCFSKKPFPISNLKCLYGIHERCLNNLVSRFDEGLITDLYSFFRESWCMVLYHDRFPDFREEIRELLLTSPSVDKESLEEKMRRMFEEDMMLNEWQLSDLKTDYKNDGYKRAVEMRLLSFLSYNYYHLPMYAKPGMV